MTPEERIQQLESQIAELMTWRQARELQFIPYPLDQASKDSLGVPVIEGTSSTGLTQSVSVSSTPTNISVPAALSGFLLINADGITYKVGHYGTV